jgi:hypothetical protein
MSGPLDLLGGAPERAICSRAGCAEPAVWRVEWSNPRIHTDGRTKVWLACDAHVDYLRGFVEARSFPVAVTRFAGVGRPDASGGAHPAPESNAAGEDPRSVEPQHPEAHDPERGAR